MAMDCLFTLGPCSSANQRYESALANALASFRSLLSSSNSKAWKPISGGTVDPNPAGGPIRKGKSRAVEDVLVHRRTSKGADVIRAVCEIPLPENADTAAFKAVLQMPQVRSACVFPCRFTFVSVLTLLV